MENNVENIGGVDAGNSSAPNPNDVSHATNDASKHTDDLLLTRFFDWIGDLFSKMVRGILVFAFKKLPVTLWHLIFNQKLFRLIRSAARMIFWGVIWIAVVFSSWLVLDIEKFMWFWRMVWNFCWGYIAQVIELTLIYANEIWIVIALLGSVYGLLYIPGKIAWRSYKRRRDAKRGNVTENA